MEHTLIFDSKLSGHHLEYLGHLWRVCENKTNRSFIFLVPQSFREKRLLNGLQDSENITVLFLSEEEQKKCNTGTRLSRAWHSSRIITKYSKRHSISKAFLISIVDCLPFLPFCVGSKMKVSGIIYGIYLYKWKSSSIIRRIEDVIKYSILARSSSFQTLFLLNDMASVRKINCLYRTSKFKYLPDPFMPIVSDRNRNLREEYGIDPNSTLFIHFGSLSARKGTMTILESLELLAHENNNYAFVFAGHVLDSQRKTFYYHLNRVKEINTKIQIIVEDTFCDYPYLGRLCEECDVILIPYLDSTRSSGILGYASQFGKPVIAPSSGLIGRLVKRYKLGYLLPSVNPSCLCDAYKIFDYKHVKMLNSEYLFSHDVQKFLSAISSWI